MAILVRHMPLLEDANGGGFLFAATPSIENSDKLPSPYSQFLWHYGRAVLAMFKVRRRGRLAPALLITALTAGSWTRAGPGLASRGKRERGHRLGRSCGGGLHATRPTRSTSLPPTASTRTARTQSESRRPREPASRTPAPTSSTTPIRRTRSKGRASSRTTCPTSLPSTTAVKEDSTSLRVTRSPLPCRRRTLGRATTH